MALVMALALNVVETQLALFETGCLTDLYKQPKRMDMECTKCNHVRESK